MPSIVIFATYTLWTGIAISVRLVAQRKLFTIPLGRFRDAFVVERQRLLF